MSLFDLQSHYAPSGDQPQAIKELTDGLNNGEHNQVLLGVTGSGKTYTMANIIQQTNRPAMVLAHNKTLAAQLYSEMKAFFPNNAVEYFVSYYDYYQPEAYVPRTDTFIEKDAQINEQIDRMRHSATRALFERKDVIIVASVSCIYGLGSPETYLEMRIPLAIGQEIDMNDLVKDLIGIQYTRNDIAFERGTFRVRGDTLDIFPAHSEDRAWRLEFFGDEIETITEFDSLTGETITKLEQATVFANSHYVTPRPTIVQMFDKVKNELKEQLAKFNAQGKLLEAQRLEQRVQYDLEMLQETGMCKGIENYSRYLSGRPEGAPPPTLFEYFPKDALLFMDESHATVPQIGGMYKGDRARKNTLVDHGFRLPSALDNRPLKFEEWDSFRPDTLYVSATPGKWELEQTNGVFSRMVIRPTGLLDPVCEIRPVEGQVDDVIHEVKANTAKGQRTLVTTLTKKMSENLTEYLREAGLKVTYLHSDIDTLERVEIIHDLRKGVYDVLVGINLLREGLDIPECSLVLILDADKAGFLRSETSLIQTIGRAARHIEGRVVLYADIMTNALTAALAETEKRRAIQLAHNEKHNIKPAGIARSINDDLRKEEYLEKERVLAVTDVKDIEKQIKTVKADMLAAAGDLNFELAAKLRDKLRELEDIQLGLAG